MYNILICDDDRDIVAALKIYLSSQPDYHLFEAYTGREALDIVRSQDIQLVLLDIMMPFINGMDAAKEIRGKNTTSKIIFLTSSPEFAIESYDVEAAGYLLKPVNEARLFALLNKCLNEANRPMDSITLHTISGYQNVYLHNIEYLEAQNKKVIIALNDGSRLETASTLSFYEKQLTIDKGFFKCHRSYIVYMPAIDHFNNNEIITKTGVKLSIARGLGKMLQDTYFTYMFSE